MKKLLNTLFVTTEDAYLSLDGENVVVNREKQELARFPLHTLSARPLSRAMRRRDDRQCATSAHAIPRGR